jgi:hypothetical protein
VRVKRMPLLLSIVLTAGAFALATPASPSAAATPSAPFSECPSVGSSASCKVLVVINNDRTVSVYSDASVGPYDGIEDTLVGIRNDSSTSVDAITATGTLALAGFDGDGLCAMGNAPPGCPFGPTGYEGPGTSFIRDPAGNLSHVEVDFANGLAPGAHTYFSLEESLDSATITVRLGGLIEDIDGDGLPDDWEDAPGRDLGGGLFDGTLHTLGASSDHKDIFVQIDAEVGAEVTQKAQDLITQAFAKAPVSNPDGSIGIRLHFVKGGTITAVESDDLRKANGLPNWQKVYDRFSGDLETHAYHYVVSTLWDSKDYAGRSDGIPGQFVALSNCGGRTALNWFLRAVPRKHCSSSDADQASNLMHELGHNLGLHHGGGAPLSNEDEEDPYKPNYFSVMSYNYGHGGIPGIGVDYSHWDSADVNVLDENSLAERDGVYSANPSNPVPKGTQVVWYCPKDGKRRTTKLGQAADWNCTGNLQLGRVSGSIDWPGGDPVNERNPSDGRTWLANKIILHSHSDWSPLLYNGDTIGAPNAVFFPGADVANLVEPTPAQRNAAGEALEPRSSVPAPKLVSSDATSVAIQTIVAPNAGGRVSWAPVLADGADGPGTPFAEVPSGKATTLRITIPRSALAGAIGVAVTLETDNWVVGNAVRLR